jgi:hypothetical protein
MVALGILNTKVIEKYNLCNLVNVYIWLMYVYSVCVQFFARVVSGPCYLPYPYSALNRAGTCNPVHRSCRLVSMLFAYPYSALNKVATRNPVHRSCRLVSMLPALSLLGANQSGCSQSGVSLASSRVEATCYIHTRR